MQMSATNQNIKRHCLVLDSDTFGRGDDELGARLIVNFLRTLAFLDQPPEVAVCYNGGSRLTTEGSPALPFLQVLADKGTEIIICGTCVDHFQIRDQVAVGRILDMHAIVEALMCADSLITV